MTSRDSERSNSWCEAVRLAILATAWLLVVVCLFLICLLGYQGMALYSLMLLLCPIPFRFPFSSPPFLFHSLPSFPLEIGPLNPAAVTGTQMNNAGTHHVTAAADGVDDGVCATCRLTELSVADQLDPVWGVKCMVGYAVCWIKDNSIGFCLYL